MIGTRVNGVVSAALRDIQGGTGGPGGRWSKVLALATKVSDGVRKQRASHQSDLGHVMAKVDLGCIMSASLSYMHGSHHSVV